MTIRNRKIVIIGGTSAIAEHCARLWLTGSTVDLSLVGRDQTKLERVAADLRVRSPQSRIDIHAGSAADFIDPAAIKHAVDAILAQGPIDLVLIAHGSLPDQGVCQQDLVATNEALSVNGISPVLFAEAFAGHMQRAGRGTLAIIGSVAGDRGRRSNYVYGAAKGLVARYAQGLQHRLADTGVKVVLVKPGPTATPMTEHLRQKGANLARVEDVAKAIVAALPTGAPVVYTPSRWALIMMVVRHLPGSIFNRMNL